MQSFDTGVSSIRPVKLLNDESIFIHGAKQDRNKLKLCNLHTGTEICGVDTSDDEEWGISPVELSGKFSLAISFRQVDLLFLLSCRLLLSLGRSFHFQSNIRITLYFCYRRKAVIEFRDLNNLNQILHTYLIMEPRRLCQVSPSVLLINCVSSAYSEIHWLDCSTIPPKENSQKKIIIPGQTMYWDMCFVQEQNKNLVIITADGPQGIHAYNANTTLLEWRKKRDGMEKAGVASDSHGHLFVFDKENGCINLLSVSDGHYQGCLIKEGEQSLGKPCFGVWCEQTSSLIVAHAKGNERFISVIKVHCA